jgi:hypothetical protein
MGVLITDKSNTYLQSNDRKYELTDETLLYNGRILYRIQAVRDIPEVGVKAGDFGGFIQNESNLSHEGNAWIGESALVFDDAKVQDNALILDKSLVFNHAKIYGDAIISGDRIIWGFHREGGSEPFKI